MSVARIQGKKGVREVAQVCKELGYKFILVGRISQAEYMQQVLRVNPETEFIENATEEQLLNAYYRSAIHVCNSVDGFESGTLPILEAMACGVPVLTRMIGHVPDLYNGKNMIIRVGITEDVEDLKIQLKQLMENRQLRENLREGAWETVKNRDDRRMALETQKLYYMLYKPSVPLVSIIIPTKDRPEALAECLISAIRQEYPKFEVIIADSGDMPIRQIVEKLKSELCKVKDVLDAKK
jgi:glycosyltransferase involved in cell wall biosynthesis